MAIALREYEITGIRKKWPMEKRPWKNKKEPHLHR